MGKATLLRSVLEDLPCLFQHLLHGKVFLEAHTERFLDVDILAGTGGEDTDRNVPVIRGGDVDGIDIILGKEFAEVGVGLSLAHFGHGLAPVLVAVGGGNALEVGDALDLAEERATTISDADMADSDAFAGGGLVFGAQGTSRYEDGCGTAHGSKSLEGLASPDGSV